MSILTTYVDSVTQSLVGFVLPTLSMWIKSNKGIDVSAAEMMEALKIDSTSVINKTNFIGVNNPVAPPATGRKKTTPAAKAAPVFDGPTSTCVYKFTRKNQKLNKQQGDICGSPTIEGTQWCCLCLYKPGGGGRTKSKKSPSVKAGLSVPGNLVPAEEEKEVEADPHIVPGYLVIEYNGNLFVIDRQNQNVYGTFHKEQHKVERLTDALTTTVRNIGLTPCVNDDILTFHFEKMNNAIMAKYKPVTTASFTMTSVNGGMPVMNGVQMPQMQGMPQMPGMPQMQMPTMPQMNGVPTMPMGVGVPTMIPNTLPTFTPMTGYGVPSVGK